MTKKNKEFIASPPVFKRVLADEQKQFISLVAEILVSKTINDANKKNNGAECASVTTVSSLLTTQL